MIDIAIVDYGMCNARSIANMLRKAGHDSVVTSRPGDIETARKLVLPGVGSFDQGMTALQEKGLREVLERKAHDERVPILGICLGAQLMTRGSEEGEKPGLGWLPATTRKFVNPTGETKIKTPHMGWNHIRITRPHSIFNELPQPARFYFLHSYHFEPEVSDLAIAETIYGNSFASGLAQENLIALQFHPEKSHRFGLQVMNNFASIPNRDT